MASFERKFANDLVKAESNLKGAENLVKVVVPRANEPRILLKALEILEKEAISIISLILKYEYINKKIQLGKNNADNLKIFFNKCATKYDLGINDKKMLKKFIILGKKHKESGFEFSKNDKIIILDDDLAFSELTSEMIIDFINILRKLLDSLNHQILKISINGNL